METRASAPSSSWSEPDVAAEASASEGDSTSLKRSPQTAGLSGSERKRPANGGAAPALTVRTLTERQIEQRQKQIDHGKNTKGYDEYIRRVKKSERTRGDPVTPDKHKPVSKRQFDGLLRSWRRKLHKYDPDAAAEGSEGEGSDEDQEDAEE